ncbi:hypothetical protein LZ496_03065 [Sphingomonas sp. NSE70-1]|uniref:DUF2336 domain-containing protein n=1 Tax=Sphingomonas caseinilyticus TaxID=2908205 RepID=A0ABT0RRY9_9SPHN|nr:hypothetical protein [Sphingomonas caseinilyticus]MCL6697765.1 hypothetical protein [Sphingomonas caseinilyticus]
MMPVEWPLAAGAADRPVDPARPHAGRDRLPAVMTDFFLDEASRLTDEERALMAAMLRSLVLEVADELISQLPPLLGAKAEHLRDGLYRQLRNAGLLERQGLVSLLLRRADEQQLSGHAHRGTSMLGSLVGDQDGSVAESAMALTLARGRRLDKFGRLGAEFDDVAAEDAVALVNSVAAALWHGLDSDSEMALIEAVRAVLARHDEGRRLEATVASLARGLESTGRGDDGMVATLAGEGDAALLAGLLARRAGIDPDDAWRMFTSGEAMMLARLAGCERATAAQILAAFEPMSGAHSAERFIDRFDGIDDAVVEERRHWLRLDPHYRTARQAFGLAHG